MPGWELARDGGRANWKAWRLLQSPGRAVRRIQKFGLYRLSALEGA